MSEFRIKPDTAPGTPPPGLLSVYSKTDKKLYIKDDAGAESLVGPGDGITQLTGDVTAGPGYGSQAATVAFVGGLSAAQIVAAAAASAYWTRFGSILKTTNPDRVLLGESGDDGRSILQLSGVQTITKQLGPTVEVLANDPGTVWNTTVYGNGSTDLNGLFGIYYVCLQGGTVVLPSGYPFTLDSGSDGAYSTLYMQGIFYQANVLGSAGDSIEVEYKEDGVAGSETTSLVGNLITVHIGDTSILLTQAWGFWDFSANPLDNDSITLEYAGYSPITYRFKNTPSDPEDVQIGTILSDTLDNFVTKIGTAGISGEIYVSNEAGVQIKAIAGDMAFGLASNNKLKISVTSGGARISTSHLDSGLYYGGIDAGNSTSNQVLAALNLNLSIMALVTPSLYNPNEVQYADYQLFMGGGDPLRAYFNGTVNDIDAELNIYDVGKLNCTGLAKVGSSAIISDFPNIPTDPIPFQIIANGQIPMVFVHDDGGTPVVTGYVKGDSAGALALAALDIVVVEAGGFGAFYQVAAFGASGAVFTAGIADNSIDASRGNICIDTNNRILYDPAGNMVLDWSDGIVFKNHYSTTATSYTVLNTDRIVGVTDTSASRVITLPSITTVPGGVTLLIKDESGGAADNWITVVPTGAATIDGETSIDITANYGVLRLYSNGVDKWLTI